MTKQFPNKPIPGDNLGPNAPPPPRSPAPPAPPKAPPGWARDPRSGK
jgi:hypothetical protein